MSRRGCQRASSPTQSSDSRLKATGRRAYVGGMLRKPIELPPEVSKAFVKDMQAFFKAKNQLKEDEIAARQCWALQQHVPRGTKLRLSDVKEVFRNLKGLA
jgi:hypothetical protein